MAHKANLANALLALGITASATTISLQSGQGANMPTNLPYKLTLAPFGQLPTKANSEIVLVTARSTDTLTVVRGVNGTTARAFVAGDIASNGVYIENSTAVGDIFMSLRSTPEVGRLFMDGSTYTKAAYPMLYQFVIDNPAYGTTDQTAGSESFTLEDMRERMPFGRSGNSPFTTLGYKMGTQNETLTVAQMPNHQHGIRQEYGVGGNPSFPPGGTNSQITTNTSYGILRNNSVSFEGGGQPHNNMPPIIVVNYEVIAG